jgi:hypothetical protein
VYDFFAFCAPLHDHGSGSSREQGIETRLLRCFRLAFVALGAAAGRLLWICSVWRETSFFLNDR